VRSTKIVTVVLTYNNYDDTRECLQSIAGLSYASNEVLVVDNGSRDDSIDKLEREFPTVAFLHNGENLGYAGGNNKGIEYALARNADAVWLLNNDTTVDPEALTQLVKAASSLEDAGILGSMIYLYDSPQVIHFAGGKLDKRRAAGRHIGGDKVSDYYFDTPLETDFITGASLLAKREMIEAVGMLDEAYFLYKEDLDWALRAREAGWHSYIVPGSMIRHKVNRTTSKVRPLIIYYACRNSLYLCRRHFPLHMPEVLAWCIYSYIVAYLARWVLAGFSDEPREYLRMGWRGCSDFFRGRMGAYND
jgi:GT2 family glycosyltransferase